MSKPFILFLLIAFAAPGTSLLSQGRSAVSGAELDAAVAKSPSVSREAVRSFLSTDQTRKVASQMGINTSELSVRVAGMDQASLNVFAQRSQVSDQILAGGQANVVISTTAIIIILLLLILLLR